MTDAVMLGFRLLLAFFAAFVGWYAAPPLLRILYRLAFHRPTPGTLVLLGRLTAAGLLAVVVFLFMPLGGGGGLGWGSGGGGGGLGLGSGTGKGTGTTAKVGQATGSTEKEPEKKKEEFLPVELIVSSRYQMDGRYYLVKGEEPPKTLEEVKEILEKNPGRWKGLTAILYANTPSEVSTPVVQLEALARQMGLDWQLRVRQGIKEKASAGGSR